MSYKVLCVDRAFGRHMIPPELRTPEISPEEIQPQEIIGEGSFGKVRLPSPLICYI